MNTDLERVKAWVQQLQHATEGDLARMEANLIQRRIAWFQEHRAELQKLEGDILEKAYRVLLARLEVEPEEAPIVEKSNEKLVFHSKNFCPALEACKILGLDTRVICRLLFERPADELVKQVDKNLRFGRNYECIRPYADYCEESITIVR